MLNRFTAKEVRNADLHCSETERSLETLQQKLATLAYSYCRTTNFRVSHQSATIITSQHDRQILQKTLLLLRVPGERSFWANLSTRRQMSLF